MPITEIERRLSADVTSGRHLRDAAESIAASAGAGVEDLLLENAGPVQETVGAVTDVLAGLAVMGRLASAIGGIRTRPFRRSHKTRRTSMSDHRRANAG